eukprot:463599-Rhodomonas_salina.2
MRPCTHTASWCQDPSGRIVLTKERNWEQFQHEIPEGGDPMLTLITEPNKVFSVICYMML